MGPLGSGLYRPNTHNTSSDLYDIPYHYITFSTKRDSNRPTYYYQVIQLQCRMYFRLMRSNQTTNSMTAIVRFKRFDCSAVPCRMCHLRLSYLALRSHSRTWISRCLLWCVIFFTLEARLYMTYKITVAGWQLVGWILLRALPDNTNKWIKYVNYAMDFVCDFRRSTLGILQLV